MIKNDADEGDILISHLRQAILRGTALWDNTPGLLKRILAEEFWRHRVVNDTHEEANFECVEEFITTPPLKGLGTTVEAIKRIAAGDREVLDMLDRAIESTERRGRPNKNRNNVTELTPTVTGNSAQGALRRLRKSRPDLHALVLSGEKSAHRAMIEAGFREGVIALPLDASKAAKSILRHFKGQALEELLRILEESTIPKKHKKKKGM
jgi:hypothetical protein